MNLIALSPIGGDTGSFHLNADQIVAVQRIDSTIRGKTRTVITMAGGQTYNVDETPEDIVEAAELAKWAAADRAAYAALNRPLTDDDLSPREAEQPAGNKAKKGAAS